jgi:hypothetical protein
LAKELNAIPRTLPPNTFAKHTPQKGQPIRVEVCTPEMLLEEMRLVVKTQMAAGSTQVESLGEFKNAIGDIEAYIAQAK